MKFNHIEGLIAAPFTPFHDDGSLNLDLVPAYYRMLKSNGVVGAFICGSTGEGVSMSTAERKAVAEAWAKAAGADKDFKIMTLVGGTSIAECTDLAAHAGSLGIWTAFTAPFYFKPANAKVLADVCARVAAANPNHPFYYYHIPVLTGVGIAMYDLLQQVGNIPNFAGVKYTHEDFMDFLSCTLFENGKYDMLWGRDENMLPSLAIGSKGAVGSTYNYAPALYYQLMEAYHAGRYDEARELQEESIRMIRLLGKYGGIATGKAYMKLIGLNCGAFRLPVSNMSAEAFEKFSEDVSKLRFYSYCSKLKESHTA